MIKKQTLAMLVCAVMAVALIIVYFAVISPMLITKEEEPTPIELIDDLEVRASDVTKVYMFPPVERARIEKIEVYNENGGYTFYKKSNQFFIEGMESAPYDLTMLSYLVTTTGSSVAMRRYLVDENTNLADYGLAPDPFDPEDDYFPTHFVITTEDGETHKVWVGDKIPTGGGYYCQYDGRNAIYVLGSSLGLTIFSDIHELITPTLGLSVPQNSYSQVSKLGVIKNGVPLVEMVTVSPEENGTATTENPAYSYKFNFEHLKEYTPNSEKYNRVINAFSGLAGYETVAAGEEFDFDTLKTEYGIDIADPFYCVYYTYINDVHIYFSKPNNEGVCYAYSSLYDTVVRIKQTSVPMYYDTLSDYVQRNIITTNITLVSKLEIKGSIPDENIDIDSRFGITTEGKDQTLINLDTNENYDNDEMTNFRQVYKDVIRLYIEGEVDLSTVQDAPLVATVILTETDGTVRTLEFFAYNNTRCYFKINGVLNEEFAFYVNRDNVETLLRDTNNFNLGYTIDPGI